NAISVTRPPTRSKASRGARSKTVWAGCGCRASTCSSCTRMSCRMLPTLRADPTAARMTLYPTFVDHVRPVFEKLRRKGHRRLGTDGHHPDTIIKLLGESPTPEAVKCIENLLDSPDGIKFFDGTAIPREVMAAGQYNRVGNMGLHTVQSGDARAVLD